MTGPKPVWRPLTAEDLPAVEAIAGIVHPGFFEAPEIFAERLALHPAGTLLLEGKEGPLGYVLSHPWRHGALPALNVLLGAIPKDADSYYIHDLALLPGARGSGAGAAAVALLADHARALGLSRMGLVAVNASQGFWARQGFAVLEAPELAEKLLSYELEARYMARALG